MDRMYKMITVHSNVLVYRSRTTQPEPNLFALSRVDGMRRVDSTLQLARREAQLDEAIINARNIALLF